MTFNCLNVSYIEYFGGMYQADWTFHRCQLGKTQSDVDPTHESVASYPQDIDPGR